MIAAPSRPLFLLLIGCFVMSVVLTRSAAAEAVTWKLDRLDHIAGAATQIWGQPRVTDAALVFDGVQDGLLVETNPLERWDQFTIEVLIRPVAGGGAEQRFLHVQDESGMRVLLETRVDERGWWLDTFLYTEADRRTLIDPQRVHPLGQWHWVALRYDGKGMAHYVNGVREAAGPVKFGPMRAGRVSLGVRQNRVYWFKGAIREVRFTSAALPDAQLQRVP